jgi:hypothetical protein
VTSYKEQGAGIFTTLNFGRVTVTLRFVYRASRVGEGGRHGHSTMDWYSF